MTDLREKYCKKFRNMLTPAQIPAMYRKERQLRGKLRMEVRRRFGNPVPEQRWFPDRRY